MNKEQEFIFRQAIANCRLESLNPSEEAIELLRRVIENNMTDEEAIAELKQLVKQPLT